MPLRPVVSVSLRWTQQSLYRAALIHGSIALGDLLKRQGQIEYLAGVNFAVQDQVHQFGKIAADGGGAAVEVDVREEQFLPVELNFVRDADERDVAAFAGGAD